jgi:hypothetical protein
VNIYKCVWLDFPAMVYWYDKYDSMVVVAKSAEEAALMHPAPYLTTIGGNDQTWATAADRVSVTLIGTAAKGVEAGVICASFNAG